MDPLFLVIILVLGILAILDLVVGVSNDAVNFLNASLGSRVAPRKIILLVASVGIVVGCLTSNGMMEVARKGVFHPEAFDFTEIMILFASVMLSDVLLLNTFNRLGLPTSTTVSLVFELLGGAVGVALYHIWHDPDMSILNLGGFINSGKAMVIISGILLSVVIAFSVGAVVMFVSRLLFSFRFKPMFRHWGAVWCGVAMTGIVYFALFKGLKDSGLMVPEFTGWVNDNLGLALLIAWGACSLLLGLLQLCRVNILRVTILAGTGALALAFAGNDLVNFIGVPLAGWDAFRLGAVSGDMHMGMAALAGKVSVSPWILLFTGMVMVATLWVSRDAMRVSKTTLDLSSSQEQQERFASSRVSRLMVRAAVGTGTWLGRVIPPAMRRRIDSRLWPVADNDSEYHSEAPYDHIRAVVNLTCAAILICAGTMLQLPLSTTYVVFMVAMGTSLADRAWGRDSAVYRVTGVLVVISGWFVTAVAGFLMAFCVALALLWGTWTALILACLICGYILVSQFVRGRGRKSTTQSKSANTSEVTHSAWPDIFSVETIPSVVQRVDEVYTHTLTALYVGNRHELHACLRSAEAMYRSAVDMRQRLPRMLRRYSRHEIAQAQACVQATDHYVELAKALLHVVRPAWQHVDNNHRPLTAWQIQTLKEVNDRVDQAVQGRGNFDREGLWHLIDQLTRQQIMQLKEHPSDSTRASSLYLQLLGETKNLCLQIRSLWHVAEPDNP